jgi:CBS domain-containing protein
MDLRQYLQATLIDSIAIPKNNIVTVPLHASLEEAIQTLANHNILSAPVFDPEAENYLGFIDVLDILKAVLAIYSEAKEPTEIAWMPFCQDLETLSHRGVRFAMKSVKNIIDFSKVDPYFPVFGHGTLLQLMEVFAKGVHRTAIVEENNFRPQKLVSQSDIINAIVKQTNLGNWGFNTVKELNLGSNIVITMPEDAQAIQCFYLMFFHKISAVGIVSKEGKLIGNLSASDIRGLRHDNFASLLQPVMKFLEKSPKRSPITCKMNTTFETVLLKLSFFRIHRMWIVDDEDKPIGLISLTDIMRFFVNSFQ